MLPPHPPPFGKTIYYFHLKSVNKPKTVRILYLEREVAYIIHMKGTAFSLDPATVSLHWRLGAESHQFPFMG